MTVKLTPEYIETLIDAEEYLLQPEIIICKLTVGESVFVGEAHCFDTAIQNVERGKGSARRNAISRIFDAGAYHLKRERDKLNRKHGIHNLPIYEVIRKQGGCIRLTNVAPAENHLYKDIYSFTFVDPYGGTTDETIMVDRLLSEGVDAQLQRGLRILCLKGQSENMENSQPIKGDLTHTECVGGFDTTMKEQDDGSLKITRVVENSKGDSGVSPSVHECGGVFSGTGAGGSLGERKRLERPLYVKAPPLTTTIIHTPTPMIPLVQKVILAMIVVVVILLIKKW